MDFMIPKGQSYISGTDQKVMNVNNPEQKHVQTNNPVTSQVQIKSSSARSSPEGLDKEVVLRRIRHHKCKNKVKSVFQALVGSSGQAHEKLMELEFQLPSSSQTSSVLGSYHVLNITSTAIIVDLPAQCDRPLASLSPFFGENYALSAANSLLLQNCSKPLASPCEIRPMFLETSLDLNACLANSDNNISCFAGGDGGGLLSFEEVNKTQCRFLLSSTSIAMDSTRNSVVSLELGRINLDWWVKGDCNCDKTANCTEVKYGNSTTVGFKCLCKEGFEGHGFKEGGGCHRRGKHFQVTCNL
ncbi:hypothetical protein PTKIN_Ptkin08bG0173800 [Pterospermum kingtungense]